MIVICCSLVFISDVVMLFVVDVVFLSGSVVEVFALDGIANKTVVHYEVYLD